MKIVKNLLVRLMMWRNLNVLGDGDAHPRSEVSNRLSQSASLSGRPPMSFGLRLAILAALIGAGAGVYLGVVNKSDNDGPSISPTQNQPVTTRPKPQVVSSECVFLRDTQVAGPLYGLILIYSDGTTRQSGFC